MPYYLRDVAGRGHSLTGWVADPQQALHYHTADDASRALATSRLPHGVTVEKVPPKQQPGTQALAKPMFSGGAGRG